MNLIIASFLELLSFCKKNNKILFLVLCFFLWYIASQDVYTDDRAVYRNLYNALNTINIKYDFELGFQILICMAKKIGLSFKLFIRLGTLVAFFLMAKALLKISYNPAIVMGIYMLYPFLLDAEQIRSFWGTSIVLFGLSYVLTQKKNSIVFFIISCFIAASLQISCLLYLIYALVLLPQKDIKKYVVIFSFYLLLGRNSIIKFFSFLGNSMEDKIEKYFTNVSIMNDIFIYILYYSILIFLTLYLLKKQKVLTNNQYYITYINIISKINIISVCFIPLLYINGNFERLFRMLLIIDYCAITNLISSKIKTYREFYIFIIIISFSAVRFMAYVFGAGWNRLIIPFFLS